MPGPVVMSDALWDSAGSEVERWLDRQRNSDGGWGYGPGRPSRLEPTCWGILATGSHDARVLARWPRRDGLPVEGPSGAVNIAFAGLAACTWLTASPAAGGDVDGVLHALGSAHGVRLPQSEEVQQDNSLQGWPWVSGTFTWVEPTAWCLLALKRWRRLGADASWVAERIAAGEAVLADRAIPGGGWNYGNPRVYGKVLSAFVPTTALALLALRDRPQMPVVVRGLAWLAGHRLTESSRSAMGLAAMCLDRFGADVRSLRGRLVKSLDGALRRGDTIAAAQLRAGLAGAQARDPFAI